MSSIKLSPNASGTGEFTIAAPNSNTNRTLTLPDQTGTVLTNAGPFTANASASNGAVTIDASNNVGIGTSSPSYPLHVVKNASGAQKVYFSNNSTNSAAETAFSVSNGTAEGSLRVAGTSYSGYGAYTANNTLLYNDTSAITIMADNATNGIIKFAAGSNAERARITSSGTFLVGTTNETGDGGGNEIRPNAENGGLIVVKKTSSSVSGNVFVLFARDGTPRGSIALNGTTAVSYNTTSDYRLKENIAPMTGALSKVALLKPCTYTWKSDGAPGQGFIAHELAEVVPDAVTGEKDAVDADGKIKPQAIDTSFLVATLTAAIQELKAEVDALKAQLGAQA